MSDWSTKYTCSHWRCSRMSLSFVAFKDGKGKKVKIPLRNIWIILSLFLSIKWKSKMGWVVGIGNMLLLALKRSSQSWQGLLGTSVRSVNWQLLCLFVFHSFVVWDTLIWIGDTVTILIDSWAEWKLKMWGGWIQSRVAYGYVKSSCRIISSSVLPLRFPDWHEVGWGLGNLTMRYLSFVTKVDGWRKLQQVWVRW